MATADLSSTTSIVQQQYTDFPYPHRDPTDEDTRLLLTSPDELAAINHYCFQGRRDIRKNFRVLVAGGGTGDSTICLANQLKNMDAEIVHLDLSAASIEICRQRAQRRGIEKNIRWEQASLLDLPEKDWEPFDYINCTGVLHHLKNPPEGLLALKSKLKPDGALGLMLYGRYGRTGVYQMQKLMRLVNRGENDSHAAVENTKQMLNILPDSNWLRHQPELQLKREDAQDTDYYDMFLHSQDRPYSIPEIYELLAETGLHFVEFSANQRLLYDPRMGISDPVLLACIAKLSIPEQQAVAELFLGFFYKHTFWVSQQKREPADPRDPENVPVVGWNAQLTEFFEGVGKGRVGDKAVIKFVSYGMQCQVDFTVNEVNLRLLKLIDGSRTMGQIVEIISQEHSPAFSIERIWNICSSTLEALGKNDFILLEHSSVKLEPSQRERIIPHSLQGPHRVGV